MQRLFSTFPNAWPGAGLLVLRLVAAIPLLGCALSALPGVPPSAAIVLRILAALTGGMLLVGLWTPVGGVLTVALQLWSAVSDGGAGGTHLLLASVAVSLVMLGPGAWSVDARIFGRRRIHIRE
ncbi:MAG TPA: hypothetical protein VGR62_08575 [Candidatus Binatia bacterium]|nr:hypothetical protein [Candidatus Binatia bacterium]